MKYVEGDIVIRIKGQATKGTRDEHLKGAIFKLIGVSNTRVYYKISTGPYKEDVRFATSEEKMAFEKGITNIRDIIQDNLDLIIS